MSSYTALVTGGSSGLGIEFARQLAERGHKLILTARSVDKLQSLADELNASYPCEAWVYPVDLSSSEGAKQLCEALTERHIHIDILINNAGVGAHGAFLSHDWEEEVALLKLNILSLSELCHRLGQQMAQRGEGYILNVASLMAFMPSPFLASYAASKAYVYAFSQALSEELSPQGVKVHTFCPGITKTGFQQRSGMVGKGFHLEHPLLKYSLMEAAPVVTEALDSLFEAKRMRIPGLMNRIMALGLRAMPTPWTTKLAKALQG
ncbi:MAG: SDR family oxidoreductase [Deinococcales bacterium]